MARAAHGVAASLKFTSSLGEGIPRQSLTIRAPDGSASNWEFETASGGEWLSVNPRSGSASGSVDVTVTAGPLPAGEYFGSLIFTDTALNTRTTITVVFTLTGLRPKLTAVVNTASHHSRFVAPGEIVVLSGSDFGLAQLQRHQLTPDGLVDTMLAGVRVLVDGKPAPLIYVASAELSAIVPYSVRLATSVPIETRGLLSSPLSFQVAPGSPVFLPPIRPVADRSSWIRIPGRV